MPISDEEWVGNILMDLIEEHGKQKNYTQMAKDAGLHKSAIYNIMGHGTGNVMLSTAQAILDSLGYDLKVIKRK